MNALQVAIGLIIIFLLCFFSVRSIIEIIRMIRQGK